jgi:hypothetical protein
MKKVLKSEMDHRWWFISTIPATLYNPATQEAKIGRSWSKVSLGKSMRPCLIN